MRFLLLKHSNFQPQTKILKEKHLLKLRMQKLMVVSANLDKDYNIETQP